MSSQFLKDPIWVLSSCLISLSFKKGPSRDKELAGSREGREWSPGGSH
jgi:hypothetical protein